MVRSKNIFIFIFLLNIFNNNLFAETIFFLERNSIEQVKEAKNQLKNGNVEKSLASLRLLLQKAINQKNDALIAELYAIIAANFEELSEFNKAITFYNKSLFFVNKSDDIVLKNNIYNKLGNLYSFEINQSEKGIQFYKKALELKDKKIDSTPLFLTNLNITKSYFDSDKFNEGAPYLNETNKLYSKWAPKVAIANLNVLNGMYYGKVNNSQKATFYFSEAIKIGKSENDKKALKYSYYEFSKYLLKNKQYKKAYDNLALYNIIKDEIYKEDKFKKINIAGINIELDEYKREIDQIKIEKDVQYQSLKKSKLIVILFLIALCILLLLIYSLFKNNNFKKKAYAKLSSANEALLTAKEKAEESSLLKTQFVSTISHELRTPLYGVIGITNILIDEHEELAQSPHLSSLKFSAKYLLSLVNDILQINKIEENRIVLETHTFNLSDEINMIKKSLLFLSNANNNKITVNIDANIPEYLIGDKLRLSQIIMNLVSNALKFTKNGEVLINANLEKIEDKLHHIKFEIKDDGIGIADVHQNKIFEKFVQIDRNKTDYQGTGLGLSIVKQLLGVFGSNILLESAEGKGTLFTFTIPFESDWNKTTEIINNIQVDMSSSQIYRVLVVDDNLINQLVTKKTIEKNNFICTVVSDGYAALEMVEKEIFDVILMDINMPLMNGFEATRRIRHKGIKTPVVALTAYDKSEITEEAISSGINDIVIKPFESIKLFNSMNSLIFKTKNTG